jgi:hypothetical protein
MKKTIAIAALALQTMDSANAQVPQNVLVEHFTNTWCSVCASRNPGFYTNLNRYPQVLHIAYHPSSPYVSCPLSMHNPTENDARTNFYGLYGSTPRFAIGGTALSISTNVNDSTIYTSQLGKTTSFALNVSLTPVGTDSLQARVAIVKADTSSLTGLTLYGAVVEELLTFAARNGENNHHDVFRKAIWGSAPVAVTAPSAVGDSVVYTKRIAYNALWTKNQLYAMAILQQPDKKIVQANRSTNLPATSSVPAMQQSRAISLYPNPATGKLYLQGATTLPVTIQIVDMKGAVALTTTITATTQAIDISLLSNGTYIARINDGNHLTEQKIIKN